jgi:hypothetical protein
MKTKCHIMLECCPDERDNFFDLICIDINLKKHVLVIVLQQYLNHVHQNVEVQYKN